MGQEGLHYALEREGFRVVQLCLLGTHIHLNFDAHGPTALASRYDLTWAAALIDRYFAFSDR